MKRAVAWRVGAVFDDYEQASAAGSALLRTGPVVYMFQALDEYGEPLHAWEDFEPVEPRE